MNNNLPCCRLPPFVEMFRLQEVLSDSLPQQKSKPNEHWLSWCPHVPRAPPSTRTYHATQCTVSVRNPEKTRLRASSPRAYVAAAAAPDATAKRKRVVSSSGPATAPAEAETAAATDSGGEVFVYEFVVTVKYVRREIRDLTDRDRETYFNAVSVLQRVPSAVGRAVYGDRYYSKDYFNRMHLYYGKQMLGCVRW